MHIDRSIKPIVAAVEAARLERRRDQPAEFPEVVDYQEAGAAFRAVGHGEVVGRVGLHRALISGLVLALNLAPGSAADLTISVAPRWRGAEIAVPSTPLANDAGQLLRFTRVALLVSEVALLRADGGTVRLEGQFGFVDVGSGRKEFTVRGVPAGAFVGLEFRVGLPAAANLGDPGRWPAGHALNPVLNGLHWSWQGGYVFAALEGRYRAATVAAGGTRDAAERGFSFHLATQECLMAVGFRADWRISGDTTVELALDLARALEAHRLAPADGSESTHSGEGDTLAPRLATALERAWFWLDAKPTAPDTAPIAMTGGEPFGVPLPFNVPAGFPQPDPPADNLPTAAGVALGEALFFDPRLSGRGTQSCASCHAPARAFSDTVALSRGAEGDLGRRNAMPLFNLAWSPSFGWDGSQPRIRDQALAAWTNPVEMHAEPARVVAALARDAGLAEKFRAAFGSVAITSERITLALEQYLLVQIAADSRFDRALRGEAEMSAEEKRGFELFMMESDPARGRRGADCFHCHGGALFSDYGFKNNGLDREGADAGRGEITLRAVDHGKFKTPSLRNVALTAPYMHDGRLATLEEVVAHYDHGVQRAVTLDPNLAKHPDAGLGLSPEDQRALVAFLRALTDLKPER
jgi:cytochrome c peroxidase